MAGSYISQDIQMTDTGGFLVAANGDFQLASLDQTVKQDAVLRLYTDYGDFQAIPAIGSMIKSWIGKSNNVTNAQGLQAEVIRALTNDGQFAANDISVRVVPIAIDTISVYVTIQNAASTNTTIFMFSFNFTTGLVITYTSN